MSIFKTLFIPKEKAQQVTELQSWSVTWWYKTGWSDDTERRAKTFIKLNEAQEFEKQLIESAKFIGCWLKTDLSQN